MMPSRETSSYAAFLDAKRICAQEVGFDSEIMPSLFPFQRDICRWALRRGRAAIFADCGLGKTPMQLEWARRVSDRMGSPVMIFAPLAVSHQTKLEGDKFGIPVTVCRGQSQVRSGVNITNYEMLEHFTPESFAGVVLDESSILKSMDGKTRTRLIDFSAPIHFRLACTATPAPNDHMELGNHAEFLSIMNVPEMLATFFTHDGGETSKWRLKGHAADKFWAWVATWAVMLRRPSDLGYDDEGFALPELRMHQITVKSGSTGDALFPMEAQTLLERRGARRDSLDDRVKACANLVATEPDQSWLIWCDLNSESTALSAAIPGAVEVKGADDSAYKERSLLGFTHGGILVSKPSIAGWGLNYQHCARMVFVGLSDSYEQLYQAIRRCWRFGQIRPVEVYLITAETEGAVVRNIKRKETEAAKMAEGMLEHMKKINTEEIHGAHTEFDAYSTSIASGNGWAMHLGDCVETLKSIADYSVDYIVYSPPFSSLYTYSNSERDMGNARNQHEFEEHYRFLAPELIRVLKPGRLLSFHCMNLPVTKERDGFIGIRDFRGDLIRIHQGTGFIYHSEVCIWKDPVTAMQRTKALGLLYKQIKKDSAMSRQGIPDYLVTMRKPGVNPDPVTKTPKGYPVSLWQRVASPVWMDINPSDTLQKENAREERDERHICPLQLDVIRRAVRLWTNPGDMVLSPFAGIGSEGYVALELGRCFIGVELKQSYWKEACRNLKAAEAMQSGLFPEPHWSDLAGTAMRDADAAAEKWLEDRAKEQA